LNKESSRKEARNIERELSKLVSDIEYREKATLIINNINELKKKINEEELNELVNTLL